MLQANVHICPRRCKGDPEKEHLECPFGCGAKFPGLHGEPIKHRDCPKVAEVDPGYAKMYGTGKQVPLYICPLCGVVLRTGGTTLGGHYKKATGPGGMASCVNCQPREHMQHFAPV